jgi:crotonobetainyl-CoA:carnitine CoA-transferase CaiB-like acyl-CoA transferase
MTKVMEGVRVLEVALYGLVPTAGAVLADWGADVIKVEHPETGDPIRGLVAWGIRPGDGGVTYLWEVFNRGKKSIGIDIRTAEGREVLLSLAEQADVFLTNFLEPARKKLQIDVDDVMLRNPRIIYARGTGHGPKGPDAAKGGFDGISYWARAGVSTAAMPADYGYPIQQPGPAFGDIQTGMHLAGGVAAALYHRERTGNGLVVDTSLLASGMWAMQASMAGAYVSGRGELPRFDRRKPGNPLANVYRTADNRFINLAMLESDRYWPGFCQAIGRPELAADARYATDGDRMANLDECIDLLDSIFAEHDLDKWRKTLASQDGQWAIIQTTSEVLDDIQAEPNGYLRWVPYDNGATLPLVVAPVQFDGEAAALTPGPAHAADTDQVLMDAGYTWDDLLRLKERGAIS